MSSEVVFEVKPTSWKVFGLSIVIGVAAGLLCEGFGLPLDRSAALAAIAAVIPLTLPEIARSKRIQNVVFPSRAAFRNPILVIGAACACIIVLASAGPFVEASVLNHRLELALPIKRTEAGHDAAVKILTYGFTKGITLKPELVAAFPQEAQEARLIEWRALLTATNEAVAPQGTEVLDAMNGMPRYLPPLPENWRNSTMPPQQYTYFGGDLHLQNVTFQGVKLFVNHGHNQRLLVQALKEARGGPMTIDLLAGNFEDGDF